MLATKVAPVSASTSSTCAKVTSRRQTRVTIHAPSESSTAFAARKPRFIAGAPCMSTFATKPTPPIAAIMAGQRRRGIDRSAAMPMPLAGQIAATRRSGSANATPMRWAARYARAHAARRALSRPSCSRCSGGVTRAILALGSGQVDTPRRRRFDLAGSSVSRGSAPIGHLEIAKDADGSAVSASSLLLAAPGPRAGPHERRAGLGRPAEHPGRMRGAAAVRLERRAPRRIRERGAACRRARLTRDERRRLVVGVERRLQRARRAGVYRFAQRAEVALPVVGDGDA